MENQTFIIEDELKKLPGKPGVYLMHGEKDEIIYVGKAISLKNRVRQYFQPSRNRGAKIDQMVTHITRFEYIVTDSELEALVLECNLIKEHRPKYNTMLMDDKSYPFIKVTTGEAYPRIMMARQMKKDKSKYFGPYTSVTAVKDTIELIRKLYRLRSCNRILPRDIGKERCCLYHHIKQCDAPCQGYISQEKYRESVDEVLKFLGGNYDKILKDLEKKMQEASDDLEFEKAIEYRELLHSVKQIAQKQKITDTGGEDRDIVALAREHEDAVVQVFFIRNGRLIGRDHFYLRIAQGDENAEILSSFIKQFYAGTPYIPGELMLPVEPEEREILEAWLGEKRGHKVHFRIPKKGEKEKLVELAAKNAKMVLEKDKERIKREEGRTIGAVKEIEKLLGLNNLVRMEAYDISNTNGFASVGSMIVYERGKPKRNDYRKFHIKGVQGADDYASMREVLTRRFRHGLEEQKSGKELGSFNVFPDLIMMDGGKDKERIKREEGRTIGAVKEIEKLLGLNNLVRMEAYDISNTNGFASVGSMIVYERGKPKRNDYRKFHIKGVQGADDYASMREVLTRRFRHGLEEQKSGKELGSFNVFPDLIMMDGGKGQVNIALEVLDELHISIPVCGMVKDDHHRTRGLYYQNIEIPIDHNSEGFRLITRVQDEAHRFAIEFHRKLRSQGQVHSILDDIPGIGPARRKALMRTFASLDEIKNAEVEDLKKIPSMDEKSAKNVYNFFRGSEKEDTEATLMEEQ